MPTASVQDYVSDRSRTRLHIDLRLPALALAALIVIAVLAPALQPGPFVKQVTIVNNSDYATDVSVARGTANDWMLLGTAAAHSSTTVSTVFDQGSTWTFRYMTQGRDLGEIVKTKADLASAGWRVVIPGAFAAKLRRDGVVPTA